MLDPSISLGKEYPSTVKLSVLQRTRIYIEYHSTQLGLCVCYVVTHSLSTIVNVGSM